MAGAALSEVAKSDFNRDMGRASDKINDGLNKANQAAADLNNANGQVDKVQQTINDLAATANNIKTALDATMSQMNNISNTISQLNNAVSGKNSDLAAANGRLNDAISRATAAVSQRDIAAAQAARADQRAASTDVRNIRTDINGLNSQISQNTGRLNEVGGTYNNQRSDLNMVTGSLNNAIAQGQAAANDRNAAAGRLNNAMAQAQSGANDAARAGNDLRNAMQTASTISQAANIARDLAPVSRAVGYGDAAGAATGTLKTVSNAALNLSGAGNTPAGQIAKAVVNSALDSARTASYGPGTPEQKGAQVAINMANQLFGASQVGQAGQQAASAVNKAVSGNWSGAAQDGLRAAGNLISGAGGSGAANVAGNIAGGPGAGSLLNGVSKQVGANLTASANNVRNMVNAAQNAGLGSVTTPARDPRDTSGRPNPNPINQGLPTATAANLAQRAANLVGSIGNVFGADTRSAFANALNNAYGGGGGLDINLRVTGPSVRNGINATNSAISSGIIAR